jgi:hypothetical protein
LAVEVGVTFAGTYRIRIEGNDYSTAAFADMPVRQTAFIR